MHSHGVTETSARLDQLSTAVIEAIAEHEGVDPLDLEQPLYEVIDPDALDSMFPTHRSPPGAPESSVTFRYNGCEVCVTSAGGVRVRDRPAVSKALDWR